MPWGMPWGMRQVLNMLGFAKVIVYERLCGVLHTPACARLLRRTTEANISQRPVCNSLLLPDSARPTRLRGGTQPPLTKSLAS